MLGSAAGLSADGSLAPWSVRFLAAHDHNQRQCPCESPATGTGQRRTALSSTERADTGGEPVSKTAAPLPTPVVDPAPHVKHERSYGNSPTVKVVRVHDGDTIIIEVPTWPSIIGDQIEVRLYGFDAPEIHDTRPAILATAQKAKARMAELCAAGVTLTDIMRDKYFRLLANIEAGGQDVGQQLAREGLVKPYTGEGPKPW